MSKYFRIQYCFSSGTALHKSMECRVNRLDHGHKFSMLNRILNASGKFGLAHNDVVESWPSGKRRPVPGNLYPPDQLT